MMNRCREPLHPAHYSNLSCFYDEPVWNFEENYPAQCNDPVFKTGFSNELNEGLSQFQVASGSSSGSDVNRAVHPIDEKKQRRMVLNRESARRCRWRKKIHLENLSAELNLLKVQNREFKNRLSTAACLNQMVRLQNEGLKAESLFLWARLGNLSEILLAREIMNQ